MSNNYIILDLKIALSLIIVIIILPLQFGNFNGK